MALTIRNYRGRFVELDQPPPLQAVGAIQQAACPCCGRPVKADVEDVANALEATLKEHPHISRDEILGEARFAPIMDARRMFAAELHFNYGWHPHQIAKVLGRDRTSVMHLIGLRATSKVKYATLKVRTLKRLAA